MLRDTWILLKLQAELYFRPATYKQSQSRFRFGRMGGLGTIGRAVLILLVLLLFSLWLGSIAGVLVSGLDSRSLLVPIFSSLSAFAALSMFLLAIPTILAALTYNSDMGVLLLTPMSPRVILGGKFLSVYATIGIPMLVIGMVVMGVTGSAFGFNGAFWVGAVLSVLFIPITPIAIAMLITVLALRWIPPARARTITALFSAFFGIMYFLGSQILASRSGRSAGSLAVNRLTSSKPEWFTLFPPAWPGRAAVELGTGHYAVGIVLLIGSVAIAFAAAALAIGVTARLMTTGWASYQEVGRKARKLGDTAYPSISAARVAPTPASASVPTAGSMEGSTAPAWWPLVVKEWRTFRRDTQLWARLLYPAVIVAFFIFRSFTESSSFGQVVGPGAPDPSFFFALVFATYFLLASLAMSVINREGRMLQWLSLAPLTARDVLAAKWAFSVIPALVVAELLIVIHAVVIRGSVFQTVFLCLAFAALIVALAGELIYINLLWPKFTGLSAKQQVSRTAGWVSTVAGMSTVFIVGVLAFLAVLWASSLLWASAIMAMGIFGLTAGITAFVLALAPARLDGLMHNPQSVM